MNDVQITDGHIYTNNEFFILNINLSQVISILFDEKFVHAFKSQRIINAHCSSRFVSWRENKKIRRC